MPFDATPDPDRAAFTPEQRILILAADLIRIHGHIQRTMGSEVVGFCMLGAIGAAAGRLNLETYLPDAVNRLHHLVGRVPAWNDHPGRTPEQVIAALEAAVLITLPPTPVFSMTPTPRPAAAMQAWIQLLPFLNNHSQSLKVESEDRSATAPAVGSFADA